MGLWFEYAILWRALAGSFPGVVTISCLVERTRRSVDPAGEEAGNRNVDFHGRRHFRALVCQYAHDEICGLTEIPFVGRGAGERNAVLWLR